MENTEIESLLKEYSEKNKPLKFFNKETIVYAIAIVVTLIWACATIFLIARALKLVGQTADLTAVLSVYSTVTATFMVVLNFYFSSTKSSQEKSEQVNKMIDKIGQ